MVYYTLPTGKVLGSEVCPLGSEKNGAKMKRTDRLYSQESEPGKFARMKMRRLISKDKC